MSDHGWRFEPELIEHFVIVEDQVPDIVERLDRVRVAGGRSWVLGRIDGEVARQQVEHFVPYQAVAAMEIDQCWPLAGDLNVSGDLFFPQVQRLFRSGSHITV